MVELDIFAGVFTTDWPWPERVERLLSSLLVMMTLLSLLIIITVVMVAVVRCPHSDLDLSITVSGPSSYWSPDSHSSMGTILDHH